MLNLYELGVECAWVSNYARILGDILAIVVVIFSIVIFGRVFRYS